jgi:hypothetical protein
MEKNLEKLRDVIITGESFGHPEVILQIVKSMQQPLQEQHSQWPTIIN